MGSEYFSLVLLLVVIVAVAVIVEVVLEVVIVIKRTTVRNNLHFFKKQICPVANFTVHHFREYLMKVINFVNRPDKTMTVTRIYIVQVNASFPY